MQNDNIYNQLGYTSEFLTANSEIANLHPDYADLVKLEADKFYFSGNHPAVLFVNIKSFSSNDELRRIAAIQHKAWNYRKVILLFALSETEIRIYNCYAKPTYIKGDDDINLKLNPAELLRYDTTSSDVDTFNILVEIFFSYRSRQRVIMDRTARNTKKDRFTKPNRCLFGKKSY